MAVRNIYDLKARTTFVELRRGRREARALFEDEEVAKMKTMVVEVIAELAPTGSFTSPGELYSEMRIRGYEGTQRELTAFVSSMVGRGEIRGRRRGQAQNVWYGLTKKSLERSYA